MSSNPEVRPHAKHRTFTADEKARILAAYESAASSIERAAVMRREGVYSSLLSNWRKQSSGSVPKKRGRPGHPEGTELTRLRDENERLRRRLERSERKIDALGKAHALLQIIAGESAGEQSSRKS